MKRTKHRKSKKGSNLTEAKAPDGKPGSDAENGETEKFENREAHGRAGGRGGESRGKGKRSSGGKRKGKRKAARR